MASFFMLVAGVALTFSIHFFISNRNRLKGCFWLIAFALCLSRAWLGGSELTFFIIGYMAAYLFVIPD